MNNWFKKLWSWHVPKEERLAVIKRNLDIFKKDGMFFVLAFDHRGSFIKMMQEHSDRPVEMGDAIMLKEKIIARLGQYTSGVLVDEDYGLPGYTQAHATVPFLLPAEKTGYTDEKGEKINTIERNAQQLKSLGAHGVKLLLYVHHLAPSWNTQMDTARKVIADAHAQGLPVFLEFVLYSLDGKEESSVLACVEKAVAQGVAPDVWKLPYPGSLEASEKVTMHVGVTPWVLLTGGGTFENFKEQYTIALAGGAKGFVAGRSLWQEACTLFADEAKLQEFLQTTLVDRFSQLTVISSKK